MKYKYKSVQLYIASNEELFFISDFFNSELKTILSLDKMTSTKSLQFLKDLAKFMTQNNGFNKYLRTSELKQKQTIKNIDFVSKIYVLKIYF